MSVRPDLGLVGYAPGVYDMFHVGHLNVLRRASERCDYLIAGVVSDEKTLRTKGKSPVVPSSERLEVVEHIRFVDEAVVEDTPTKLDLWAEHPFDIIFKGDDWRGTAKGDALERDFASVGVEVCYLPYTMHTSSTLLRQRLENYAS